MEAACRKCRVVLSLAALVFFAAPAFAVFPDKPIRILIGTPAGTGADAETRVFAKQLAEELGQPVVVENKPGGSGLIAMEALVKAAPDGYTLATGQIGNLGANPRLFENARIEVERDLVSISLLAKHPWLVYVNRSVPVRTLGEFIALVKARPDQITYASAGIGSFSHISGEWFRTLTGGQMRHVPYGARPWQSDLLAGHVDAVFYPAVAMVDHVRTGRLRALAISGTERSPQLPDVPTFVEAGVPEFSQTHAWFALVGPAGISPTVMKRLSEASVRAAASAAFRDYMTSVGAIPLGTTPAEADTFLRAERTRWKKVIRDAGIKVE
jgi:tripartite-type tricarboxylate transporter receptor subunit TctC